MRSAAILSVMVGTLLAGWTSAPALAQATGEDAAAMALLHSGRRAYNEGQYPLAVERFDKFVKAYPAHAQIGSASYGLALAMLETEKPDYAAIGKLLATALQQAQFADRPYAMQYMGLVLREQGRQIATQMGGDPKKGKQIEEEARKRFEEAARNFGAAAEAMEPLAKAPSDPNEALGEPLERSVTARCDQCEMLLRAGKAEEAAAVIDALQGKAWLGRSAGRELARYYQGYAKFQAGDYQAAGKVLSRLTPFNQVGFGPHARYLLARAHHLGGQRPEAVAQYEAVIGDYEAQRASAAGALKTPQTLPAGERSRLTELAGGTMPDYVVRASFYAAVLMAELGKNAEAAERLGGFVKKHAGASLSGEAQLRLGWCQLQLKDYAGAIKTLEPLAGDDRLGDRALWWMARARLEGADPANAEATAQAVKQATEQLLAAAEKARALAAQDAGAKVRRADILMDLGDAQQLARQFNQASETYRRMIEEKGNAEREEEAMQRRITAVFFSGQYPEADALAADFQKRYPRSTLLAAVLFRRASATKAMADSIEKDAKGRDARKQAEDVARHSEDAVARYKQVAEEFSEFKYANAARYAWGQLEYRMERYGRAASALAGISEPDRTGELAGVSYLQADCLIRTLPAEAEDAIVASELVRAASDAAKLLESFLTANAASPEAPDALLKLGYCHQRMAMVTVREEDRKASWEAAKSAYERFGKDFSKHADLATATFERARCLAMLGDTNNAMNELRRFGSDPLRQSAVAPLAMAKLSAACRAQNRAAEAVGVMAAARAQFETELTNDPASRPWAAMLVYEHAMAVKASGKLGEAAEMFDVLARQPTGTAGDWGASAAWRAAQCRREETAAKVRAARAVMEKPGVKKEEMEAAKASIEDATRSLQRTIDAMEAQADNVGKRQRGSRTHLRLLYDLAWCYRVLGEGEKEEARQRAREKAVEKLKARSGKVAASAPGEKPEWESPILPAGQLPIQPAEAAARRHYRTLIAAAGRGEMACRARLEQAEMETERGQHDVAAALLSEAMEKDPPAELAARIRVRLAEACLARGKLGAALEHAKAAGAASGGNEASEAAKIARYLAGEAAMQKKDWAEASKQLLAFRDNAAFGDMAGISDRALLRLGQAFAEAGQWDQSRRSLEMLRQKYPASPWLAEAIFGLGWAMESEKRLDDAVRFYDEVTRRAVSDTAAKAQYRIGVCRLAQGKTEAGINELLAVPVTYGYPAWNAAAWLEAGKAYEGLKRAEDAAAVYKKAASAEGPAAVEAKQKLGALSRAE